MLTVPDRDGFSTRAPRTSVDAVAEVDLHRLWRAIRRQLGIFTTVVGLSVAAGGAYLAFAVPLYTAHTQILVESRLVRGLDEGTVGAAVGDVGAVESQVEVLRSAQIGLRAIEALALTEEPDIVDPPLGLRATISKQVRGLIAQFGGPSEHAHSVATSEDPSRSALKWLQTNLSVGRVGRTYVLNLQFTDSDPVRAARIANAIAEAYLTDQLEAKYDATRRASIWLQERVIELQEQTRTADFAVQQYKVENNLLAAGGQLISDQQLAEISTQLVETRAETARVEARYDGIRRTIEEGRLEGVVGEVLDQPTFAALRSSYLEASQRREALASRLGEDHVQVLNLDNVLRQYQRLMLAELRQIADSYYSELEVARSRQISLETSIRDAFSTTAAANQALVGLSELEGVAASFRLMLETVQQRLQETAQRQSFPIPDARVISLAAAPERAEHPKASLVLALFLVMGSLLGAGAGVLRELSDRVFRTGSQVREELSVEFLGMLPLIPLKLRRRKSEKLVPEPGRFTAPEGLRYAIDAPLSPYSETLRAIKVATDVTLANQRSRVIGIVSMLPGEGKTTTAKNLASLMASQGAKVLLIDGDLRNPGLTRSLLPHADRGLMTMLLGDASLSDLVSVETDTGLHVLPAAATRVTHTADLMASAAMQTLLQDTSASYDYVVVDCPPVGPVVDVRAAAALFDAFVFVVEWGKTPRSAIRAALHAEHAVRERCVGLVLNKVSTRKLMQYEQQESKEFYQASYQKYYRAGL